MRPLIRREIIDLYKLAAGILTENVSKTGKPQKTGFKVIEMCSPLKVVKMGSNDPRGM